MNLEALELIKKINENFTYEDEVFRSNKSGKIIRGVLRSGSLNLMIEGKYYAKEYLVWVICKRNLPDKIIHIDGNKLNNQIGNLKNVKSYDKLTRISRGEKDIEILKKAFEERFYYKDGKLFFTESCKKPHTEIRSMSRGYLTCSVCDINFFAHRVIYLMLKGEYPELIDHIDRNPLNNRIENLRSVDKRVNSINRFPPSNNASGIRGVSWSKSSQKWSAQIKVDQRKIHLGVFSDINDAKIARDTAEIKYWGEITNNYD